jgi:hypothetical protein
MHQRLVRNAAALNLDIVYAEASSHLYRYQRMLYRVKKLTGVKPGDWDSCSLRYTVDEQ